jgi:hypothetical protein
MNSQDMYFILKKRRINTISNASFFFTKFTNWKSEYNNFSFNLKQQFNLDSVRDGGFEAHARIYLELGKFKIVDSSWFTSADIWELQHDWLFNSCKKKWSNSLSIYLTSKFLSSYETVEIYDENDPNLLPEIRKNWVDGFFNPFRFEASYGKTITFWKNSRFDISLAKIIVNSEPLLDTTGYKKSSDKWKIGNTVLTSEYGFGFSSIIRKKFNKYLRLESNNRFFCNGINTTKISFDFKNSIILNPIKYMTVTLSTRHLYKPKKTPFLVQQRYEAMIGFEF